MTMIAKDEATRLRACFDSFWDHVDQVVLVDTGSSDGTLDVARAYAAEKSEGDKLITSTFAWVDDFAAARQHAWDLASTPWAVWCDLDDVLQGAENLRSLAANAPAFVAGFIFPYDYAQDEAGNCICFLERERLVRRGIGEHWELPIHEVLRVDAQLVRTDQVRYVHVRADKQIDPKRNYRVLKRDWERSRDAGEEPNPRTLVYLGTESLALGKVDEAIRWLKAYLRAGTWDEELCQAAHKLSIAYRQKQHLDRAEQAAYRAIGHRPDWPDGYLDLAEIAMTRGNPERALLFIAEAKQRGRPETLLIINPLDYTYQPLIMESVALAQLGRVEEAFAATQQVLAITPYRDDVRAQATMLAEAHKRAETIKHVLALHELLRRHDENLAAHELLTKAVPYYVRDDPQIAIARADCRENVLHATDPEVYARYYRDNPGEAPFEVHEIAIETAHEAFPRLAFLREGLEAQAA